MTTTGQTSRYRSAALAVLTTWLTLAGVLAAAGPAQARNVGGTVPFGSTCYTPGGTVVRSHQANAELYCFCYVAPPPPTGPGGGDRNVGGFAPDLITNCPPGILKNGTPTPP